VEVLPRLSSHTPHTVHGIGDDISDHLVVSLYHMMDAIRRHELLAIKSRARVRRHESIERITPHIRRSRRVRSLSRPGDIRSPRRQCAAVRAIVVISRVCHQAAVKAIVRASCEELDFSAHGFFCWCTDKSARPISFGWTY
jgi:hypothetical protein